MAQLKFQPTKNTFVLVVDDDVDIRESIQEVLEDEGYRVQVAANGLQALKVLDTDKLPGIILLDLMMPGMNGYEFISAQQKDPRLSGIPVAVLTADGGFKDKREDVMVAHYLRKPIQLNALLELVAEFV